MSDFITLTCPNCGGRLEITRDIYRFSCVHCGAEHIVRRGGGIVSIIPVLHDVSKGVDNTACELAIVRLDKEINSVMRQLVILDCKLADRKLLGFFGIILIIGSVFLLLINDIGCTSIQTIGIVLGLIMLLFFLPNKDVLVDIDDLKKILNKLQQDRNYYREKLNRSSRLDHFD